MSSHHRLNPTSGEMEYTNYVAKDIGKLYLSDDYSDVTLIVCGQRFNAHRIILAARSQYFKALLYGGLKESSQDEIELKETTLPAFKGLLKYIYTGHMSLANMREEVILDILSLVHQYGFKHLEIAISDYLQEILSIENVCLIFDATRLYQLDHLTKVCREFIEKHASDLIRHDSFIQLSLSALIDLISRDSFYVQELDIFLTVNSWLELNPDVDPKPLLDQVRLSLMTLIDLLTVVRRTGLVSPEAILDAIDARTLTYSTKLMYRGRLLVDENVAHPRYGAEVLEGEMRNYLLDGDTQNYDMERGYTRHHITAARDCGIVITLSTQSIINHIKMLLWDRDHRSYSYYIEVSVDRRDWAIIIDYRTYYCRSWQYLYFAPRASLYIRITGTNNTVNRIFHLVHFEACFTNHTEKLYQHYVVPTENVATMEKSATVMEGVCRSRNALLNGDTSNYDWDIGYTCHQLGSGAIRIQLAQPYMIDSMRLLLWDCDDRSYSYYVEVAAHPSRWVRVADKTNEACRSWQTIRFQPPRPVVFIRIVGTANTANEVFHCVHFECPARPDPEIENKPPRKSEKPQNKEIEAMPLSAPPETATEAVNIDQEEDDR